jgi:hypothetical protein
MDVVTFATRVCKLLGVETMVGTLQVTNMSGNDSDSVYSYQCSGWAESKVPGRRHHVSQRCASIADDNDQTFG